jgi:hypothetical protein
MSDKSDKMLQQHCCGLCNKTFRQSECIEPDWFLTPFSFLVSERKDTTKQEKEKPFVLVYSLQIQCGPNWGKKEKKEYLRTYHHATQ